MRVGSIVLAALAAVSLAAAGAPAQAGCSLKSLNIPVKMEGRRPLVQATVNGKPFEFLLDSGAFHNFVTRKFAAEQHFKVPGRAELGTRFKAAAQTVTEGVAGDEVNNGLVLAPNFGFGGSTFDTVGFVTTGAQLGEDVSGIIGQNFLHQMDNEYDLRNGVMRFVRPQGCETMELAYWVQAPNTYSMLPLIRTDRLNQQTVAMIEINGETMRAVFDTGATTSFITRRAAARAGVKTTDPGVLPAEHGRGLDRDDIEMWVGRFASIKIGDEEIKNTQLDIGVSNVSSDDFDVLIGADFFLAHHVYVANSQGKLYFSYSGGRVFDASPAKATAAAAPPAGR